MTQIPQPLTRNSPAVLTQGARISRTYEVDVWIDQRGWGRLYSAHQLLDSQPIILKEYVLPSSIFSQAEVKQRKQKFTHLVGLSLADGRSQDFRLLVPIEAIADLYEPRCYLIFHPFYAAPTVGSQLAKFGAMTERQVRRVVGQVLQTLEFLGGQKFRLPNGQIISGLAHGNLSVETLLIRQQPIEKQGSRDPQTDPEPEPRSWNDNFLIYVCDLAIWESLFAPLTSPLPEPQTSDDLAALGQIAFYLLMGSSVDRATGETPDPATQLWPPISPEFKAFLLRLLGLNNRFETVEEARRAFLQLPPEPIAPEPPLSFALERGDPTRKTRFLWQLILLLLLLGLGLGLLWWLIHALRPSTIAEQDKPLCCIQDVSGIPEGTFTYTGIQKGTWTYALRQMNLIEWSQSLEAILRRQQPKLKLNYAPQPSTEAALEQLRARTVDFSITTLSDQRVADFDYQEIAYDGLAVFVDFSYARRKNSLPSALNGKITFEQLRRLYTGEVQNWKQLGGPDLAVQLYIPDEPEAIQFFEQRVLKDAQSISQFRNLINRVIIVKPTFPTFRQIIKDFEQQDPVGAIAFGTLSKVFGQCSVYPLALAEIHNAPVQALVEANGQAITPRTNLCNAKGSYELSTSLFSTKQYPLSYSLAVVYIRDNRQISVGQKFAEILRTTEGQQYLRQIGLVPLQSPVNSK